jgi:hypothetical protein
MQLILFSKFPISFSSSSSEGSDMKLYVAVTDGPHQAHLISVRFPLLSHSHFNIYQCFVCLLGCFECLLFVLIPIER